MIAEFSESPQETSDYRSHPPIYRVAKSSLDSERNRFEDLSLKIFFKFIFI